MKINIISRTKNNYLLKDRRVVPILLGLNVNGFSGKLRFWAGVWDEYKKRPLVIGSTWTQPPLPLTYAPVPSSTPFYL